MDKPKADFEDVLLRLDLKYVDKGNRLEMLCPFHDDTRPSSGVYKDTQRFWCFSCNLLLNVAEFYAKYTGETLGKAESLIEKSYGEIPYQEQDESKKQEAEKLRKKLDQVLKGKREQLSEQDFAALYEVRERILYFWVMGDMRS